MTPTEMQSRIKSRVWQAIAQSGLDLSALEHETLEELVAVVTSAVLLEVDDDMDALANEEKMPETAVTVTDDLLNDGKEDVLWEGRPFLSAVIRYLITDERIRITQGFFGKSSENIELVRVQDMDYKQTMSERLFNLGDITIRSHDTHRPEIILRNIKDPVEVYEILRRAVLNARKRHGFTYREEM